LRILILFENTQLIKPQKWTVLFLRQQSGVAAPEKRHVGHGLLS